MGLLNTPINGELRDTSRDLNETIADAYKRIKERTKAVTSSDESYDKVIKELKSTFEKKNSDYGKSFDLSMDDFGIISAVIRIGDKYNRLKSLTQKEQKVKDESFRDTLMDMANYAIMTVAYIDSKENENGKD